MIKDNSDFAKDFLGESIKKGKATRSMADVVGMPDAVDKEFITRLIAKHERKYPQQISAMRDWARQNLKAVSLQTKDFGITNKEASGRPIMELPPKLYIAIERHYPTMFTDRKHFRWLVKNFPQLVIPERY